MRVAEALRAQGIEPREARLLLAEACGFSVAAIVSDPDRKIPQEMQTRFLELAARRARGEPVAYLVGRREFRGLELSVNPAVLIPRPETELLVELALERDTSAVLELGTGSGAVALAIKRARPRARVVAVEASAAALAVARRNASKHALEVDFRHGRWFAPCAGERFSLIVANPPYVAQADPHLAQGDLRFEPRAALVGGADGLDAIREIARHARQHLLPEAWLLLEHGMGQERAVRNLLDHGGLDAIGTWPDLAGIARVSGAQLKS